MNIMMKKNKINMINNNNYNNKNIMMNMKMIFNQI